MVADLNDKAYDRLKYEYNFAGYPSSFFDGGDEVLVGGYSDLSYYQNRIATCGQRTVAPLDMVTAIEWLGNNTVEVTVRIGNGIPANYAPETPVISSGGTYGNPGDAFEYETSTTDSDDDVISYQWDWGNGVIGDWVGSYNSGEKCLQSYSWSQPGSYDVKVRSKDYWGDLSDWSTAYTVEISCCLDDRGNIDGDVSDNVDIADIVYLVNYSFGGGQAPPCLEEADVNGDQSLDISDMVYMVNYSFGGGPAPISCH